VDRFAPRLSERLRRNLTRPRLGRSLSP
jgi:hypothetical protein